MAKLNEKYNDDIFEIVRQADEGESAYHDEEQHADHFKRMAEIIDRKYWDHLQPWQKKKYDPAKFYEELQGPPPDPKAKKYDFIDLYKDADKELGLGNQTEFERADPFGETRAKQQFLSD